MPLVLPLQQLLIILEWLLLHSQLHQFHPFQFLLRHLGFHPSRYNNILNEAEDFNLIFKEELLVAELVVLVASVEVALLALGLVAVVMLPTQPVEKAIAVKL